MSDLNKRTPTGDDVTQRNDMKPAFNENLFEQMLSGANFESAWKHVRANKGAAGIDGLSIDDFPAWAKASWIRVKEELQVGSYLPTPVRRVIIDKPDGGKRLLGIPIILDRVIQQAIAQVLTPIFDPGFSDSSFGYRPGRSAQQAVSQVLGMVKSRRQIAVDVDLSKFFDVVNHDLLMTLLGRKIKDKQLLRLIKRYLKAGIMDGKKLIASEKGVPQGGPLSPLLANIMLDPLDKELEKRGHHFARYADDITILVKSQRAGDRVFRSVCKYLENKLKLIVNKTKSRVVNVNESKFLGFTFQKGRIRCHEKSLKKFKYEVRQLTNRNWGVSMEYQIHKTSEYLRGWVGYFGIALGYQQCVDLDQWIRRRIRMAFWRQWKRCRTKVTKLMQMGVPKALAISCGSSGKGPCRSSKTKGIQMAINNAFLKSQGLYELRDGWIKFHHSK